MNDQQLEALAEKVRALTPPDQLRLAAELLERKKAKLAYTILDMVRVNLGAALALQEFDARKVKP